MIPRAFESGRAILRRARARSARRARHRHPHARHERPRAHGAARATDPDIPVIVITAHSDLDSAVVRVSGRRVRIPAKAVRHRRGHGARIARGAAAHARRGGADAAKPTPRIIGQAPAMQDVFKAIGRLSRSSMTVLITGESGTGKELVARALHDNSPRANGAVRRAEHVGDRRGAARVGAVRSREGRVYGRDRAAHRPLRAGQRRHAVPRRDRRHVARAADAVAARARRERVLPRRRPDADPRRRPRDRGDAPGSRAP